jgi:hypothetical protein
MPVIGLFGAKVLTGICIFGPLLVAICRRMGGKTDTVALKMHRALRGPNSKGINFYQD